MMFYVFITIFVPLVSGETEVRKQLLCILDDKDIDITT